MEDGIQKIEEGIFAAILQAGKRTSFEFLLQRGHLQAPHSKSEDFTIFHACRWNECKTNVLLGSAANAENLCPVDESFSLTQLRRPPHIKAHIEAEYTKKKPR
eukprot:SAG11_NODE_2847_length_2910_cov_2.145500_2_plen_103_part_00